jgi:transposase InsO family protein
VSAKLMPREQTQAILHTAPRSSTTTGKIERFRRNLRTEFLTGRRFACLPAAQDELDEWVAYYHH